KSYDFVRACLPRGMARACSLSHILFPQASALHKIVINIYLIIFISVVIYFITNCSCYSHSRIIR
ncbi:hypothetical protein CD129_12755, partial [Mammaliicoccus fleurettii]